MTAKKKEVVIPIRKGQELYNAIFEVQQEAPVFEKTTSAHNYKYTQLSTIWKALKPILKKHKLLVMQLAEGDILRTIVMHKDTLDYHEIETSMPEGYQLGRMNLFQSYGSSLTYYKRYVICGFFGIVTEDEDNDAQGTVKKVYTKTDTKKTLNEKQFIKLMTAIDSGAYNVEEAMKTFSFTPKQNNDLINKFNQSKK